MVIDLNYTYCDGHFYMYTNTESLSCTLETNNVVVIYTTTKKYINETWICKYFLLPIKYVHNRFLNIYY